MNKVIKSVNYNQHVIIRDIIDLHNGGKPFDCDITYSIGNFYGHFKEKTDDHSQNISLTLTRKWKELKNLTLGVQYHYQIIALTV